MRQQHQPTTNKHSVFALVQCIPAPLAGLALGIASLGLCLEGRFAAGGILQYSGAAIAAGLLLLLLAKYISQPQLILKDLEHPVIGSVMPTFAMASMVISKSLVAQGSSAGVGLWYGAIALQVILLLGFVLHRVRQPSWQVVVPSWFVPPIGIVVAAVTCPGPAQLALSQLLVSFGLVCYGLMLTPMLYRLIFHPRIAEGAKPTLAILAAPASLTLAGYLTVVEQPSFALVAVLMGVALLMTALVYLSLIHLLRLPFSPGYAAFTFPVVISSTAMYRCAELFSHQGLPEQSLLLLIADIELVIACCLVGYVALRYAMAAYRHLQQQKQLAVEACQSAS